MAKEKMKKVIGKVGNVGDTVVKGVRKSVDVAVEEYKKSRHEHMMGKYRPLFLAEYNSEDYAKPNMIRIVDDAERRGVSIAEGAIGWTEKIADVEVLCLYDEAIEDSRINFVPVAECNGIYYVDPYNRNRFIRTDCIFSISHNEKMAELKHIAYALGAKKFSVEIVEQTKENTEYKKKFSIKANNFGKKADMQSDEKESRVGLDRVRGVASIELEGNDQPVYPKLKWFAHDDNIKRLIDMRINGHNPIKSETLELMGAQSATMTQTVARSIDGVMQKINAKASKSIDLEREKEAYSKLEFKIEF